VLVLQASILMTVFGFGLQATPGDVLYLVRRPGLLARSLVAMFVIMPIVALAMVRVFALRPAVEIALAMLSISPIPPLLPGREEKAGGHQSFALGLMVIAGVVSIVTVPLAIDLLGRYFVRPFAMPPGAIASLVLKTVVLPLAAGMLVRAILPAAATRIAKPMGLVATVLLAVGGLALLAGALPPALALVGNGTIVAMAGFVAAGLAVGHAFGGPEPDHRTVLALSTASRHPAIALAIAKANFPDEPFLGAAIVLFLLVNLLVGIPYQSRRKRV